MFDAYLSPCMVNTNTNRSISRMKSMFASSVILLALVPSTYLVVDAFSSPRGRTTPLRPIRSPPGVVSREHTQHPPHQSRRPLAGMNESGDVDDGEDDDRDVVYAARRSGRQGREVGGWRGDGENKSSSSRSSPSGRYRDQDDVEFFDLDDDDDDEDDDDLFDDGDYARNDRGRDNGGEITFNGIIPNPLLDAMDPDGVYERLGPELFKDWTFFRDMALFALFMTLFTGDTHLYGTFDSVIERLEDLPADFIK
jgi:hypothetical protein